MEPEQLDFLKRDLSAHVIARMMSMSLGLVEIGKHDKTWYEVPGPFADAVAQDILDLLALAENP